MGGLGPVGWLPEASVDAVRSAVAALAPELAGEPITLAPRMPGNPPPYWRGTARIGRHHMAKFAWSAPAAAGVAREIAVLSLLHERAPSLPVPVIVHASRDPALFVTRLVRGVPAGEPYRRDTTPTTVPEQLADVLATLHDPALLHHAEHRGLATGDLRPQSTTTELRERFAGPVVAGDRARRVRTWCDWIDEVQRRPAPGPTLVHGDLHAHNLVVSEDGDRLLLVADFEEAVIGDPAYDFRYLVSMRHDLDWFLACHRAYQRSSGRRLPLGRILAWHIRTVLGDALWRTERGVPLPGGLTADGYVDDITRRLAELDVSPG